MRDNGEQRVLGLMVEAGFASASKLAERRIVFGTLAYYQASLVVEIDAGVSAGNAIHSGSRISTAASVVDTSPPSNARRPESIS